jgi:uncharacterized protein (DUF433 family)
MTTVANTHIEIIDGEAHVIGTPFRVEDVAAMYVLGEASVEWIAENHPLSPAQIHAALAYYYDHQEEIQQAWRESEALARHMGVSADDVIARMKARRAQNSS